MAPGASVDRRTQRGRRRQWPRQANVSPVRRRKGSGKGAAPRRPPHTLAVPQPRPCGGRARDFWVRVACPSGGLDPRPGPDPRTDDLRIQHDRGDLHRRHRDRCGNRRTSRGAHAAAGRRPRRLPRALGWVRRGGGGVRRSRASRCRHGRRPARRDLLGRPGAPGDPRRRPARADDHRLRCGISIRRRRGRATRRNRVHRPWRDLCGQHHRCDRRRAAGRLRVDSLAGPSGHHPARRDRRRRRRSRYRPGRPGATGRRGSSRAVSPSR